MSGSPFTDPQSLRTTLDRLVPSGLRRPMMQFSFWVAVVLPFVYLPLLITGLDSDSTILAFLALVALNVLALLIGHPYGRE